tara:strand:- start:112 stop:285 length:174 start_codon:yes stop_codon:yes gene_type:complete
MIITSAQYREVIEGYTSTIKAIIDGKEMFVPTDPNNRHYAEILKQVKEGTLTIKDAD